MVSLFRQFPVWMCGVLLLVCTSTSAESRPENDTNSGNRWPHDEVIAQVPRQQAKTPSVALAKTNIAVYRAKHLTEQRLCDGRWTPRGTLLYQHTSGKPDTRLRSTEGGGDSWVVQTLRNPVNLACPGINRAEYFLEMSRHLPPWISVRPAGQITVFRLGQAFTGGQHPLAAR